MQYYRVFFFVVGILLVLAREKKVIESQGGGRRGSLKITISVEMCYSIAKINVKFNFYF